MNKSVVIAAAAAIALTLANCGNSQKPVTFREGEHYFVRNDVEYVPDFLTTEAECDSTLGVAPVMGGLPTEIDFSSEVAVPIALPVTNIATEVNVTGITLDGDTLVVSCRIERGDVMSYSIRPFVMAIVNKSDVASVRGVRVIEVE